MLGNFSTTQMVHIIYTEPGDNTFFQNGDNNLQQYNMSWTEITPSETSIIREPQKSSFTKTRQNIQTKGSQVTPVN